MNSEDQAVEDGELDLASRVLCSDGACIGVVGPDGRCKECGAELDPSDRPAFERAFGKAQPSSEAASSEAASAPGSDEPSGDDGASSSEGEPGGEPSSAAGADPAAHQPEPRPASAAAEDDDALDLASRQLCDDGACIGVIGSDGRCRECGKQASETA